MNRNVDGAADWSGLADGNSAKIYGTREPSKWTDGLIIDKMVPFMAHYVRFTYFMSFGTKEEFPQVSHVNFHIHVTPWF